MLKRHLPLAITLLVFIAGYLFCLTQFPGFASTRVIGNILTDNAFLHYRRRHDFVILSGGIDLSVGAVIAFTGVFLARAIGDLHLSPRSPLASFAGGRGVWRHDGLADRCAENSGFIITLAGMFFCAAVAI
ncbi:hypothetical protein [Mixta sp. Marseille-Q2659]|uniref:hypothetical protein n=1 Tax=Mixta sp. Marseille-Q2659 TaxID=2736607 RepID=UPI0023B929FD|nr:hypothetical protein [Mixta sp. Marseille-Q2659]